MREQKVSGPVLGQSQEDAQGLDGGEGKGSHRGGLLA